MPKQRYVAYEMGLEGSINKTYYLYCADEEDAKEQAKALVNKLAVELWTSKSPRRIARFAPQPRPEARQRQRRPPL